MSETSGLGALPARPPTPPRASSLIPMPHRDGAQRPSEARNPSSTANLPSGDVSPYTLSEKGLKRVNFSPLPSYIKAPELSSSNPRSRTPLRNLRPSKQCQPAKSILKSKSCLSPGDPSEEPRSSPTDDLPGLLESVFHQLAGECRISRTDAYMQLLGSLAAYADLPETGALVDKMDLLIQFIRRDLTISSNTFKPVDISLIHQATSLLCLLLWKQEFARHIPDDFKSYVLDLIIASLQNPETPKTIVIDDMRILSVQSFQPKILTSARVTQLLQTLKEITNPSRLNGKSIIATRLSVYEKLLLQARSVVASHATLWMNHLIAGAFHKVKDIRLRAMKFGFQIAALLGPNASVSKALHDIFNIKLDNGARSIDELCTRLETMVANKEGSVHVPQIWSIIILLLRRPRLSLERWTHFRQWILVLQRCFNCSDQSTKIQALIAWDRLTYIIHTGEPGTKDMTIFLSKPIFLQLANRKYDPPSLLLDQAISSYCNLLYYSFRPSTPYEKLDSYWSHYISSSFSERMNSHSSNARIASKILAELFWNSHPKVWDDRKAMETTRRTPEDLLRLDCKWVRSRISVILPVVESLLRYADWSTDTSPESPIEQVWIHLCKSIADASSKEVQTSPDLMKAIAAMLEMLQRLWKDGPTSLDANAGDSEELFLQRFQFLLQMMISIIKPFPFTDKALLRTTQNTFQPTSTPTHRRAQKDGIARSPFLHILDMVVHSAHFAPTSQYYILVETLIKVGISGHTSRGPCIELLSQFADILHENTDRAGNASGCADAAWRAVAIEARNCLRIVGFATPPKDREEGKLQDYKRIAGIVEIGISFPESLSHWTDLFDSMVNLIRNEKGDTAVCTTLDAIAECCNKAQRLSLPHIVKVLDSIVFPTQHARQSFPPLSGPFLTHKHQNSQQLSCENLLLLGNNALANVYTDLNTFTAHDTGALLEAVAHCLEKTPSSFQSVLLERLQTGLSMWILDAIGRYSAGSGETCVYLAARTLVSATLRTLRALEKPDSQLLQMLEELFASGFESRHKSTVNAFIREWNTTFGQQETIVYPERVRAALNRLRPYINIQLPSWPRELESTDASEPLSFLSSPEESPRVETPLKPRTKHNRVSKASSISPLPATPLSSRKSDRSKRKGPSKRAVKTTTPEARLRHDDSQITFVPVESSPASNSAPETQLLTEHQKEVRERQRLENPTVFTSGPSVLRSSKLNTPARKNLEKISSDPPTPIITAEATGNDDDFTFSSPTPGSKEHNAQDFTDFSFSTLPPDFSWSSASDNGALPPSTSQKRRSSQKSISPERSNSKQPLTPIRTQSTRRESSKSPKITSIASAIDGGSPSKVHNSINRPAEDTTETPLTSSVFAEHADFRVVVKTEEPTSPILPNEDCAAGKDVDIIPDSFHDQLEQQIASQLEQDLELSMDLALSYNDLSDGTSSVGSSTKKRKRNDNDMPRGDRNKRPARDAKSPVEASGIGSTDSPTDVFEPSKRPSKKSKSTRQNDKTPSSSQRKNRETEKSAVPRSSSALNQAGPPESQRGTKRRSLRLQVKDVPEASESVSQIEALGGQADDAIMGSIDMPGNSQTGITATSEASMVGASENSNASILSSLKSVLNSIKNVSFGRSFLREIDDLMFDIKVEAHDALRRHHE